MKDFVAVYLYIFSHSLNSILFELYIPNDNICFQIVVTCIIIVIYHLLLMFSFSILIIIAPLDLLIFLLVYLAPTLAVKIHLHFLVDDYY
jgi:hypothetical protein